MDKDYFVKQLLVFAEKYGIDISEEIVGEENRRRNSEE